jgi:hypothetical protein
MNYRKNRWLRFTASIGVAFCIISSSAAQSPEFLKLYGRVAELVNAGKIAEAVPLGRQLLAASSPNDPQFTTIVYKVAGLYRSLGRFDDAVASWSTRFLVSKRKHWGPIIQRSARC